MHGQVYGWVGWFMARVLRARDAELVAVMHKQVTAAWLSFVGNGAPIIVSLVVFATYVLLCVVPIAPIGLCWLCLSWGRGGALTLSLITLLRFL